VNTFLGEALKLILTERQLRKRFVGLTPDRHRSEMLKKYFQTFEIGPFHKK